MLKTGFLISFVLFNLMCTAQTDSLPALPDSHFNIQLSSNSSIIYPGISTGIEFPVLRQKNPLLIYKSATRSFFRERFISGNISWYHHPEFHDNVYLTVEWIMRRTRSGGFISEFSAGPGFSRTFLTGTTYKVSSAGDISVVKNAGYNYALVIFGGGFGYDLFMKKKIPVSVFSRLNMILMFPYNSTLYFRPVLDIGIRYAIRRSKSKNPEDNTYNKYK
jgi:hypothetical protein